jgi:DNA-binding MarR family transcriptional regulator
VTTRRALDFDAIAEASRQWEDRIGPSREMVAVTSIMRVQQLVQAGVDRILKPFGLSFARYEALVLLDFSRAKALPMAKMGDRLMIHPASVTGIVDRLERDGFAVREAHPQDRRTTLVRLTDTGAAAVRAATDAVMAGRFGLPEMAPDDLDALSAGLRQLRERSGDV